MTNSVPSPSAPSGPTAAPNNPSTRVSSHSSDTLTRARNTSRRLTVWMQQTWRERAIPSADFRDTGAAAATESRSQWTNRNATTPSTTANRSPAVTPNSKEFSTPQNHNSDAVNASGAASSLLLSTPPSTSVLPLNPEKAFVSNVDEALGAWTALYKFEDYFPVIDCKVNGNLGTDGRNDVGGNINTKNDDWILDGHEAPQEQYQRSRELLRKMYPENSSNMLSALLEIDKDAQESQSEATGDADTDGEPKVNNDTVVDEESLLLLKYGSAMGQQEYRFATFETADFSAALPDSSERQEETKNDTKNNNKNSENENIFNKHENSEEGNGKNPDSNFNNFHTADFPDKVKDCEEEKLVSQDAGEDGGKECRDNDEKDSENTIEPSDHGSHKDQRMDGNLNESYHQNRIETETDETVNADHSHVKSDPHSEAQISVTNTTETREGSEEIPSSTKLAEESPTTNTSFVTKDKEGISTTTKATINKVPNKHQTDIITAHTTETNSDNNFDEFWQQVIEMPTPETGTFPSIGSRSTYATSPLTSSVEVEERMLSSPSPFVTRASVMLEHIQSEEDENADSDENGPGGAIEGFATKEVVGDIRGDGDELSFGDFKECPKTAVSKDRVVEEVDENDSGAGIRVIPTTRNVLESTSQQDVHMIQSFEEKQECNLDHVNTSFETTATPLLQISVATKDLSSSPTSHTRLTPLKKNGRCQSPITPLYTYPKSDYSNREEFETPTSNRLFGSQDEDRRKPPDSQLSERAAAAAEAAAAAIEQPTPLTRNFRYYESSGDDSSDVSEKKFMYPFGGTNEIRTPNRRFVLKDINMVMNGIPDDTSNLNGDEMDGDNNKSGDIGGGNKFGDEDSTQVGEESLQDGSIQSSSIPSVVQLFTKSVDVKRRRNIVVPNTVRATKNQFYSFNDASSKPSNTNAGLTMPSFYFGRNNNSSKQRSSSEILSLSASEVASASASVMSMPMMKGMDRQGSSRLGSEKLDEPSINSSITSPEVKFFRRNMGSKSKRLLRNKLDSRRSSLSIHSRTSRTTEADDGTFDEFSQRLHGDHRFDFYQFYYYNGDDDDSDSNELTDEESVSLGSLSTLPQQYWKHPELDHTLRELSKLEWDWFPYWQMDRLLDDFDSVHNTDNIPLLQEQITNKLSKLDAFYGKICKKVYRKIQPHSEAMIMANQAALDLHQNLQLSQMYLSRSQKSIELAKYGKMYVGDNEDEVDKDSEQEGVGVHGALQLLELWDARNSLHELDRIERVISDICNLEAAISQRIQCFDTYKQSSRVDCETILEMVATLEGKLNVDPAMHLVCLDAARERVTHWISKVLVSRLHDCLSDLAIEWCHASDSSCSMLYVADGEAYSRLIEILLRIGIDEHQRGCSANPEIEVPIQSVIGAICTTIQTSLLLEIQKAFGKALLDPTDLESDENLDYEQELAALASNEIHLDANRLPIWTQNLVTIRFEFQMIQEGKHPLPAIFHKLCLLLTNVLCGLHRLIDWHGATTSSCSFGKSENTGASVDDLLEIRKTRIQEALQARRASIWNASIQSIEECLEEYLKYSGKKALFSKKEGKHDDSCWREDLEGLHDVSVLSRQFLSIGSLFLKNVPKEVINDGSRIEESLYSCFKVHLRAFHMEAMNTLGTMFYREDWKVFSLKELQSFKLSTPTDNATDVSVRSIVESVFEQLRYRPESNNTRSSKLFCRSRYNGFVSASNPRKLTGSKNPFEIDAERMKAEVAATTSAPSRYSWEDICRDERIHPLLELLGSYVGGSDNDGTESKLILKSVHEGVLSWTARLLVIIDKIPALAEDACRVMQGIIDLYVTTAFRLCAGNGNNERILLGVDSIPDISSNVDSEKVRAYRSTSPIFDFGLRSKSSNSSNKVAPMISSTAEAELCALVLEESDGLDCLREFLIASQKRLEGVAKLDLVDHWIVDPVIGEDTIEEQFAEETALVLEKRQAASCNLIFVALGLFLATQGAFSSSSCDMIREFTDQALEAMPLLITMSNRISCMRSIRGSAILREIISVGNVWEESNLHEQANEYVEEFCDFLAVLWQSLYKSESGSRLPLGILKTLWENLLGGGYMVLLDGFSKVPYCSTEGRALMSMDVASFRSGTSPRSIAERLEEDYASCSCPLPKDIRPYRTMSYVDTYIKIFYFPPKDGLDWIKANYKQYHQHHAISLVINDRDAKKLTVQVMKYYNRNTTAETIRL